MRSRESSISDWLSRVEAEVVETVRPKADQKEKEAAAEKLKDLSHAVNDFQVQKTRAYYH